jgi:periplasmic divalent cation tolerance protein
MEHSRKRQGGFLEFAAGGSDNDVRMRETMKSYIQISTTTETKEQAESIAQYLVEQNLAACVQITGPITSIYRWKGKVENAQEWLCLIKTRDELFEKVEAAIKKLHPYETPEIIAVPVVKGSKEYLNWLNYELS